MFRSPALIIRAWLVKGFGIGPLTTVGTSTEPKSSKVTVCVAYPVDAQVLLTIKNETTRAYQVT